MMTVRQLIRELREMDPRARIRLGRDGRLLIGNDYSLNIPTEIEYEIETMHLQNNGIVS